MKALLLMAGLMIGLTNAAVAFGQENVTVSEVTPHVLVFATRTGNVVASVGDDGALLVGTPSAASTPEISHLLASRTKSPVRYVVIAPEPPSQSEGDAGWERRGAFVAMQENALGRLGGHVMGVPAPFPPRLQRLGVARPRISFSEVLSFDINGEAIHIVRQPPGYSDADAIVHFHVANVIYMGEVFPGDGYPAVDRSQRGRLEGLINTLGSWTGSEFHIVPARGNPTDGNAVKAFRDMIVAVQDRIRHMVASGQTEAQILAAHPTAEFDAQWGHGRVTPDAFVREVYLALTARKTSQGRP